VAHNLASTNGKIAMFSAATGEVPWHRLGQRLAQPATAHEAIEAAGLNYEVALRPLVTTDGTPVPMRKAVIRTDSGEALGVVGNAYVPVQNRHAFAFLDGVVADGGLRYHTAGALGRGERIWLLAKLPETIRVRDTDDIVEKFLLLSNTHDGSTALRVFMTPIRVVCQNTLNLAERRSVDQGVSIAHKGDLGTKVTEARRVLGLASKFFDEAATKINFLAGHSPTPSQLKAYFREVYPDPEHADPTRARNVRETFHRLFETGIGLDMPGIKHTWWAAANVPAEYVDHHRRTRATTPEARASRRLASSWFGSGAALKGRSWQLAIDMALTS
jgi:phage/plasmid-like protein (TIGR03299 family)